MKSTLKTTISTLSLSIMAAAGSQQVSAEDGFYDALTGGKATLNSRLRYEGVDDDKFDDKASALTLRTRLGYKTGEFAKTTAFVEMSDTRIVAGEGDYAPVDPSYPKIVDPELTELNQAYLSFKPVEGLNIIAGRQRIILDNARFIGNVGWRQQEQTFDALTAKYKVDALEATLVYSARHNNIKGAHNRVNDVFANVGYSIGGVGKISGYYYALDDNAETTLDTMGVRFSGKTSLGGDAKLLYTAEYATQTKDSSGNENEADYMLAELGYGMSAWSVSAGYEILGSDDGAYGFTSKYGTNHAFNGWADKFLGTPDDGLEDLYLKAVVKAAGMKFVVMAHDFTAAESGDDLGSELDVLAVKPIGKKYTVGLKYAGYSEGDVAMKDTTKYWLWGEMKF